MRFTSTIINSNIFVIQALCLLLLICISSYSMADDKYKQNLIKSLDSYNSKLPYTIEEMGIRIDSVALEDDKVIYKFTQLRVNYDQAKEILKVQINTLTNNVLSRLCDEREVTGYMDHDMSLVNRYYSNDGLYTHSIIVDKQTCAVYKSK